MAEDHKCGCNPEEPKDENHVCKCGGTCKNKKKDSKEDLIIVDDSVVLGED